MSRMNNDDDVGEYVPPSTFQDDPPGYDAANADWDDGGAAGRSGLTARAEAAGFSPVRFHRGRNHSLEVDPRTKLRIVNVPSERRGAFGALLDVVIHVFMDCFKITSGDSLSPRVLIITDQSIFLCSKDGSVGRCTMIDQIRTLSTCGENRLLGIVVPTEYDFLIKMTSASDRDQVIKVLRTVYRRMTHDRLPVEVINKSKLDIKAFSVKKPANFRLTLIPQRTKEMLRQALEVFEQEEDALMQELDLIQDEMEAQHQAKMRDLQAQIEDDLAKLKNVVRTVWDNEEILTKRREEVAKGRKLIESVDGAFSQDGELPVSKDAQIAEMEVIVARLNAAVYSASSEASLRPGGDTRMTNYFRKDLESALYDPAWPDHKATGDLHSIPAQLQDRLTQVNADITEARKAVQEGLNLEHKLRATEERIQYLQHMQRTGRGGGNMTSGSGGLVLGGNNRSSVMAASPNSNRGAGAVVTSTPLEVYDQSYAWLSDLPHELTVETLQVDPRTNLHFVEVPDVIKAYFADATQAVLHFFAVVKKPNKYGELTKRIVLIGDQALYLATPNGDIKRCIDVIDIDEILIDANFGIGFHCHQDYDLAFQCITGEHRQEIIDILQRLFKFASGGRAIPVSEVPRHQKMEAYLKLQQPPNYKLQFIPFRSRQELIDVIREKRDTVVYNAPSKGGGFGGPVPADINMSKDEYLGLRATVAKQLDYEWRQDAGLVQLRAQLDALERQHNVVRDETYELKRKIDQHKCEDGVGLHPGSFPVAPGAGIIPSTGPGVFRPTADGLFFIQVEPTVVNCELDVLHVAMNKERFFTGHSNGFVSVWNFGDLSFLRTFRDHTGKITGMHVHENEILTASTDRTVRLWDVNAASGCKAVMADHKGPVTCLHREDTRLLTGCSDSIIRLWDIERGACVHQLKGHNGSVKALKFKEQVMVSIEWGFAIFWDLRTNRPTRTLRDDYGGINCLDYNDGIAVAGGCGGDLTVWDVGEATSHTITAHSDDVLHVQLVGKNAVTSGGDYKIKMWDLAAMKSLSTFHDSHPYETTSFALEGKRFIASHGPFVKIWSK